ncbi:RHS repeat-associated core domain-containing protein, partial [Shewanella sp. SP1S1-7]|uniref:RHS repeat domain-containing protein n=1 Tax=Shewanella sp. SP1S1-7 TaxID=3063536 RepID=UPI00288CB195
GDHTIKMKAHVGSLGNQSPFQHVLRDHLGSVDTLIDGQTGAVLQYRGYDVFGRPRDIAAGNVLLTAWQGVTKGYTDHEHLNEQQLIHMNGRIYDFNVGRFLSVDPFLQFPENSQSANPYSYILNNPMSGTDPTGYAATGGGCTTGSNTGFKGFCTSVQLADTESKKKKSKVANGENNDQNSIRPQLVNKPAEVGKQDNANIELNTSAEAATADTFRLPMLPSGAPDEVNLTELNSRLQGLWDKSVESGYIEYGGTIVDLFKRILLVNTGSGTGKTFTPDLKVRGSMNILGTVHTHPYSEAEGGFTGVSFSGEDIAYLINNKHSIAITMSGTSQFMLMRTASSPAEVDHNRFGRLQNIRIAELVNNGLDNSQASRIAASETAKQYGLAYYEGTNGVFKKVKN